MVVLSRSASLPDFPQELVLAAQASCDLGHEVFRQPQVIEGLLEGFGGVLRLAAVAREALVRFEITAPSGLGMFFDLSLYGRHDAAPSFRVGLWGGRLSKRTEHMPPRVCESGVLSASRAPQYLPTFFCQPSAV